MENSVAINIEITLQRNDKSAVNFTTFFGTNPAIMMDEIENITGLIANAVDSGFCKEAAHRGSMNKLRVYIDMSCDDMRENFLEEFEVPNSDSLYNYIELVTNDVYCEVQKMIAWLLVCNPKFQNQGI